MARSDKPLSPPVDSYKLVAEQDLLPEQIIAINNPDFVIHTFDVRHQRHLTEKTAGKVNNIFKNKRNTSHVISDKS